MATIALTPKELKAIDFACMVLLEHARRGRQKQKDYIAIDNDHAGAEWVDSAIQMTDAARVTLRELLARQKESA